jgi:ribonucleoside-diphosphate reductase beta chain
MSEVSLIDKRIFNTEIVEKSYIPLFMGPPRGMFDTINKNHPEIWELYKEMKRQDWDENEIDLSPCNLEFKTCDKSTYNKMIKTLAWQWETDTAASRVLNLILAAFVTSDELQAAWTEVAKNEILHAATYSEIVRYSFDDPSDIEAELLKVKESHERLKTVAKVFSRAHDLAIKYLSGQVGDTQEVYNDGPFMFTVALLVMERIQFMSSFFETFGIARTGLFQAIGDDVKLIARDELSVHVKLDKAILKTEFKTERGRTAFIQKKDEIIKLIKEVIDAELNFIDYLHTDENGEDSELPGLTKQSLKDGVLFMARDVYIFFGLPYPEEYNFPEENPLPFMEEWLDISGTQTASQEKEKGDYKVNSVFQNHHNTEFTDFTIEI